MSEIKLTASIDSKNIHKITEGALYIGKNNEQKKSLISEFAEGGSLDKLENGHKLSFVNIFIICYGSLIGLQELHLQKITHNDLHEGNIYLMLDGKNKSITRPIIADLGASTRHDDTLSQSFTSKVKTDARKLSSIIMRIIQSDYGITNKAQKQYLQKLFEMMEKNKWGNTQYNPQEFLEQLDLLIKEIIQKKVKDGLTLKKTINLYYPSNGHSLNFVESKLLPDGSKTEKININSTKNYRLLTKPAKVEPTVTSENPSKSQ